MKRIRWAALFLITLLAVLWLSGCTSTYRKAVNINLAVAPIVRPAMSAIANLYQGEYKNIVVNSFYASPLVIKEAIESGEKFDGVILPSSQVIPPSFQILEQLQAKGLIIPESRREIVTTDLVVIAPVKSTLKLDNFQELADNKVKSIAIVHEDIPLGQYTRRVFEELKITAAMQAKAVVFRTDVREVLKAVESGEAEVGITYLPEAKYSSQVKILNRLATPDLIRTVAAVTKSSEVPEEVQAYLDFLHSDQAIKIFNKFGLYSINKQ